MAQSTGSGSWGIQAQTRAAAPAASAAATHPGSLQSGSSGKHPWSWKLEGQQGSGHAAHSPCRTASGGAANEAAVESAYSSSHGADRDLREMRRQAAAAASTASALLPLGGKIVPSSSAVSVPLSAPCNAPLDVQQAVPGDHHVATPDTPVPLAGAKTSGGVAEPPARTAAVDHALPDPCFMEGTEAGVGGGPSMLGQQPERLMGEGQQAERLVSTNKPPLSVKLNKSPSTKGVA